MICALHWCHYPQYYCQGKVLYRSSSRFFLMELSKAILSTALWFNCFCCIKTHLIENFRFQFRWCFLDRKMFVLQNVKWQSVRRRIQKITVQLRKDGTKLILIVQLNCITHRQTDLVSEVGQAHYMSLIRCTKRCVSWTGWFHSVPFGCTGIVGHRWWMHRSIRVS